MLLLQLSIFFVTIAFFLLIIYAIGLKYLYTRLSVPVLFVILLALNQLIFLPFSLLNGSFRWFLLTFLLFFGLAAISTLSTITTETRRLIKGIRSASLRSNKYLIVVSIIIILVTGLSIVFQRLDIDDSYYLGLSAEMISSDTINAHDPSTGNQDYPIFPFYRLQAYESFIAILSFTSGLPVSIVAHTLIPLVIIPLALISVLLLIKYFYPDQALATIGLTLYSLVIIFSGKSPYLIGNFVLARTWQGKAILVSICIPLFITYTLKLFQSTKQVDQLAVMAIFIAAFSLNPSALFILPPIMGVAFLTALKFKNIGSRIKLIIPLLSIFILCAVTLKLLTSDFAISQEGTFWFIDIDLAAYTHIARDFYGSIFSMFSFLTLLLVAYVLGTSLLRRFILSLILISILVLNPFYANTIAQLITTSATYWRLFWITIPELIVTLGFVAIFSKLIHNKRKMLITLPAVSLIFLVFIGMYGNFLFTKRNGFVLVENIHKIPDSIIDTEIKLPDESKIIADTNTSIYIRAINPTIEVAYSRPHYMHYFLADQPLKLNQLESAIKNIEKEQPITDLCNQSALRDIDYIAYASGSLLGNNCD